MQYENNNINKNKNNTNLNLNALVNEFNYTYTPPPSSTVNLCIAPTPIPKKRTNRKRKSNTSTDEHRVESFGVNTGLNDSKQENENDAKYSDKSESDNDSIDKYDNKESQLSIIQKTPNNNSQIRDFAHSQKPHPSTPINTENDPNHPRNSQMNVDSDENEEIDIINKLYRDLNEIIDPNAAKMNNNINNNNPMNDEYNDIQKLFKTEFMNNSIEILNKSLSKLTEISNNIATIHNTPIAPNIKNNKLISAIKDIKNNQERYYRLKHIVFKQNLYFNASFIPTHERLNIKLIQSHIKEDNQMSLEYIIRTLNATMKLSQE